MPVEETSLPSSSGTAADTGSLVVCCALHETAAATAIVLAAGATWFPAFCLRNGRAGMPAGAAGVAVLPAAGRDVG